MMKEITGKDRFGNEYTDSFHEDGKIKRSTQTSRDKDFEFMGDTYSWDYLHSLYPIKDYVDEYHQKIELYKDKYNRLLLYFYNEYINFNGGIDREDFLWVVVKDEADADALSQEYRLNRLREPYIAGDENNWMAAHQYIEDNSMTIEEKAQHRYNYLQSVLEAKYPADEIFTSFKYAIAAFSTDEDKSAFNIVSRILKRPWNNLDRESAILIYSEVAKLLTGIDNDEFIQQQYGKYPIPDD